MRVSIAWCIYLSVFCLLAYFWAMWEITSSLRVLAWREWYPFCLMSVEDKASGWFSHDGHQCFELPTALWHSCLGANFNPPHLHLVPPLGVTPFEFCQDRRHQKTRVLGLSYGVVCVILHLAISVECSLVTDRQTDRHTTMAYAALAWRFTVKPAQVIPLKFSFGDMAECGLTPNKKAS